jgi:hypothetical protein
VYTVDQSAQGAGGGFDQGAMTLREISNWTGGREFGSDRANDAIVGAIRDARGAYLLAYERPAQKRPDQYHKLQVACDRKGTQVLSRQGDLEAASTPLDDQEVQAAINSAARAPLDSAEIGLKARIAAPGANPTSIHVDFRVDARDIFLRQSGDGHFLGRLYLVFAGYDEDGLKEVPPPEEWNMSLTAEEYQNGLRDGLVLSRDMNSPQSIHKIRCIVMDRELNATGSVTIPIPGRGEVSGH